MNVSTKKIKNELPLEIELGRTVSRFHWTLQNKSNRLLKPLGITTEHMRLLTLISYNEGCDQRFLVEETLKAKSGITALLDTMSKAGLLARVPSQKDGRTNLIYLTAKGKELQEKSIKVLIEAGESIIGDEDRDVLKKAIEQIQLFTERMLKSL
ncbi:MarR family winged helix-turn-helix transcriptional regulator [Winogradskyella sp.]|uniref:MarR family winged helix-turn-helix transcriptional regulator n=1 Tax=Winogradskyella sp. TaxID=1883156 RepID=UPI0026171928|nr:MarR family winged helix-turn-helix transcriptional regulator [Winogradskyella sp.]